MIAQRNTKYAIERDHETIEVFDSYEAAQAALEACYLGDSAAVIVETKEWIEVGE